MLSRCARTAAVSRQAFLRNYASASGGAPSSLLLIEYQDDKIDAGSLAALTAASQMGGEVTGLIFGAPEGVKSVLEQAKK